MNAFATDLLRLLWRASWQGALVITLVGGVCRAFERRLPPALRCTLWRLTYAKLLLGLLVAGGIALPLLRPASPPEVRAAPTNPVAAIASVPASLPAATGAASPLPPSAAAPVATAASPTTFSFS